MPTPKKTADVLAAHGTAHITKKDLAQRKKAEQASLTGNPLRETVQTKGNELAHKEFLRMAALLKKIKKNDDIYRNVVNRYCMLCAECVEFVEKREHIFEMLQEFCNKKEEIICNEEMTWKEAYRIETDMQSNMITLDKQIQTKRKMMLDIEKENGWTVKASIQTIPPRQESKSNPLKEALLGG